MDKKLRKRKTGKANENIELYAFKEKIYQDSLSFLLSLYDSSDKEINNLLTELLKK